MEDKYYTIKRCSNSELTRIWRELQQLPAFKASEAALIFGRMFHLALYQPNKYDERHVDINSRKMIAAMIKECRKNFQLNLFCTHPKSEFEQPHFFNFENVPFKCKPDSELFSWISDAKSTSCATKDEFIRTFDDYGYWRQAFLYMFARKANRFTFFGVQKKFHNPKVFVVNAHDYPHKLKEAEQQAKLLTLHYAKQNGL